jgi:hypothetical protein
VAVTIVGPALVEPGQTFAVSTLVYDQLKDATEADNFLFRNHTGPQVLLDDDDNENGEENGEGGSSSGKKGREGKDLTLMLRIRQLRVGDDGAKDCQLKPSADDRVSNEANDAEDTGVAWGMDTGWGCTVKTSSYSGTPSEVNFKLEVPEDTLHGDYEAQLVLMQEGPQGLTQIDLMDFSLRVGDLELTKSRAQQRRMAVEARLKSLSEEEGGGEIDGILPTETPAVPFNLASSTSPTACLKSLLEHGECGLRYLTTSFSQEVTSLIAPPPDNGSPDNSCLSSSLSPSSSFSPVSRSCSNSNSQTLPPLPWTLWGARSAQSTSSTYEKEGRGCSKNSKLYETTTTSSSKLAQLAQLHNNKVAQHDMSDEMLVLCTKRLQIDLHQSDKGTTKHATERRTMIPLHALCVLSNASHVQRLAYTTSVTFKVLADLTAPPAAGEGSVERSVKGSVGPFGRTRATLSPTFSSAPSTTAAATAAAAPYSHAACNRRRGAALLVLEALAHHAHHLDGVGYGDGGYGDGGDGGGGGGGDVGSMGMITAVDVETAVRACMLVAAMHACLLATVSLVSLTSSSVSASGTSSSATKLSIGTRALAAVEAKTQRGKKCSCNCEGDGPEKSRNGRFWIPRFRSRWLGDYRGESACVKFARCECATRGSAMAAQLCAPVLTVQQHSQQHSQQQQTPKRVAHQSAYTGCVCGTDRWAEAKREEERVYAKRKATSGRHGGVKYAIALQMESANGSNASTASVQGVTSVQAHASGVPEGIAPEGIAFAPKVEPLAMGMWSQTETTTETTAETTTTKRKCGMCPLELGVFPLDRSNETHHTDTHPTHHTHGGQQNKRHRGPTSGHGVVQESSAALAMRMMLDQQRRALARHCPSSTRAPTMAPTTAPALAPISFYHQMQAVPAVPVVPMLHMATNCNPNFNSFGLPQAPMVHVPASRPAPRKMAITPPAPSPLGSPQPTIEPTVTSTSAGAGTYSSAAGEDESTMATDVLDALSLDIHSADLDFGADFTCDLDALLDVGLDETLAQGCAW